MGIEICVVVRMGSDNFCGRSDGDWELCFVSDGEREMLWWVRLRVRIIVMIRMGSEKCCDFSDGE
jgi:hypothetical protein